MASIPRTDVPTTPAIGAIRAFTTHLQAEDTTEALATVEAEVVSMAVIDRHVA